MDPEHQSPPLTFQGLSLQRPVSTPAAMITLGKLSPLFLPPGLVYPMCSTMLRIECSTTSHVEFVPKKS